MVCSTSNLHHRHVLLVLRRILVIVRGVHVDARVIKVHIIICQIIALDIILNVDALQRALLQWPRNRLPTFHHILLPLLLYKVVAFQKRFKSVIIFGIATVYQVSLQQCQFLFVDAKQATFSHRKARILTNLDFARKEDFLANGPANARMT